MTVQGGRILDWLLKQDGYRPASHIRKALKMPDGTLRREIQSLRRDLLVTTIHGELSDHHKATPRARRLRG